MGSASTVAEMFGMPAALANNPELAKSFSEEDLTSYISNLETYIEKTYTAPYFGTDYLQNEIDKAKDAKNEKEEMVFRESMFQMTQIRIGAEKVLETLNAEKARREQEQQISPAENP